MQKFRIAAGLSGLMMLFAAGCSALDHGRGNGNGMDNPPVVVSESEADDLAWDRDGKERATTAVVTLHAVGRGIAPEDATSRGQAIILGESAARANGYVKLAEQIFGVYVDTYRYLGKGKVDFEMVHQQTQALLKGAEVLEYRQLEHGIFEVYMEVKVVVNQNHPLFPRRS